MNESFKMIKNNLTDTSVSHFLKKPMQSKSVNANSSLKGICVNKTHAQCHPE